MPTGHRNSTVVAPQALLMMNDELVMDCAEALARRVLPVHSRATPARLEFAYEVAYARRPTPGELERATLFLSDLQQNENLSELTSWTLLCQSLLASSEFMYVQ